MVDRIWLDVPFSQKDAAKAAGARWDSTAKRWYAPISGITGLAQWAALPDVPALLPGENRSFGQGLFVDLVPSSCWFTNVRSCVSQKDWERLRRMITTRAGNLCEICGISEQRENKQWLEAHERWTYDTATYTQRLIRLICLCSSCHRTTHYGHAQVTGQEAAAFEHLRAVTGMSESAARQHVVEAFEVWRQRSVHNWALDLSILTEAGITITEPPSSASRPSIASSQLRAVRSGNSLQ